jgi:hypothetical protein
MQAPAVDTTIAIHSSYQSLEYSPRKLVMMALSCVHETPLLSYLYRAVDAQWVVLQCIALNDN